MPALAASQNQSPQHTSAAKTTTKADIQAYCQLYEQTLAKDLNVPESQLEQANAQAVQAVIDQMAKDGKITAAQKTQLEQAAAQIKSSPCTQLGALGNLARQHSNGLGQLEGAHQAVVQSVANALHLSADTLTSDLAKGQTISQIASAQHVSIDSVNAAYLGAVQTQLKQVVNSGMLSQAQSDMLYSKLKQAVQSGHYP
ncbi:MAG TPA: hypothetical protein VKC57_14995, partial [Ktedonobacterales bacterium]|nr:hypothetical protein [Ktedonobacterales bacterium]